MRQIKNFRRIAWSLIAMALAVKTSAEATLAWRSLQMGRGFLGKVLGAMGQQNPYSPVNKVSEIPDTADTDPVSAHFTFDPGVWGFINGEWRFSETMDELAQVNFIRDEIQNLIDSLSGLNLQEPKQKRYLELAITEFEKAKMWYGYHLQEMKRADKESNAVPVEPPVVKEPEPPTEEEKEEANEWLTKKFEEGPDPLTHAEQAKSKKPKKRATKKK